MPAQEPPKEPMGKPPTDAALRQMISGAKSLQSSFGSWPPSRSHSSLAGTGTVATAGTREGASRLSPYPHWWAQHVVHQVRSNAGSQQPRLIAHRGGTADHPENTLLAIKQSLKAGADGVWLSVQVTRDGVPVLYRPKDLKDLTDGSGTTADKTLGELSGLNAGYHFTSEDGAYRHRQPGKAVGIPTLEEALHAIPEDKQIYLDLKQTPAEHVVGAVSKLLDRHGAWDRVRLYSTDAETTRLLAREPKAQVAESRDATRQRLAEYALEDGACKSAPTEPWVGFELTRKMTLREQFTLGPGVSPVVARLWTKGSVDCFTKAKPDLPIVMFGVNTRDDLDAATRLGAHAVLIDSPEKIIPQPGDAAPQVPVSPTKAASTNTTEQEAAQMAAPRYEQTHIAAWQGVTGQDKAVAMAREHRSDPSRPANAAQGYSGLGSAVLASAASLHPLGAGGVRSPSAASVQASASANAAKLSPSTASSTRRSR
ncbi:glycerophosphodiester phosphodiesterase family protein [Streptomyces sp. ME02-6987-2C]|uniref:glycerophosphodiester phosphodiesterase family protein n=2 Tax=Streptomyces TaxID=1883 RepID=UPI0029C0D177|nr:glycerophosphodiester phosphodiesterase family protein [Streptomyces sp. ME02-6987-2C]